MEQLCSVRIRVTVDTNKRTAQEEFDDTGEAKEWLEEQTNGL
jgi:hypothetical protein